MNPGLFLQRLLGRPTCVAHPQARLHRTARIINIGRRDELIRIGAHSVVRGELQGR
jgi:hypothetical protein